MIAVTAAGITKVVKYFDFTNKLQTFCKKISLYKIACNPGRQTARERARRKDGRKKRRPERQAARTTTTERETAGGKMERQAERERRKEGTENKTDGIGQK